MLISIAYNKASKGWVVVVGEEATFHTTRSDAYSTALGMARNAVRTESVTVLYEDLDDLEFEQ